MQKQLITDQLIEEYQKELNAVEIELDATETAWLDEKLVREQSLLIKLIAKLEFKRQDEKQNVIDAHSDGRRDSGTMGFYKHLESNDYFTQTFEQKGGEQK